MQAGNQNWDQFILKLKNNQIDQPSKQYLLTKNADKAINGYLHKHKIPKEYALHHTIPQQKINIMLGNALEK